MTNDYRLLLAVRYETNPGKVAEVVVLSNALGTSRFLSWEHRLPDYNLVVRKSGSVK
jgi:hypothetical protein